MYSWHSLYAQPQRSRRHGGVRLNVLERIPGQDGYRVRA